MLRVDKEQRAQSVTETNPLALTVTAEANGGKTATAGKNWIQVRATVSSKHCSVYKVGDVQQTSGELECAEWRGILCYEKARA